MTTRHWSLRTRITALLLVPLVALLVLWGFAVSLTARPVLDLLNFRVLAKGVAAPLEVLVTELQRERQLSVVYLAGPSALPDLDAQRDATNQAAASFRQLSAQVEVRAALDPPAGRRLDDVVGALAGLGLARTAVDRRAVSRIGALASYTDVIDAAFQLMPALTEVGDEDLVRRSQTVIALARARELLAQETAMVGGALRANRFVDDEPSKVSQLIGLRRLLSADAVAALPEPARLRYRQLAAQPAYGSLLAKEDLLVSRARANQPPPVDAQEWRVAADAVAQSERDFHNQQAQAVTVRAEPIAVAIVLRLALAGLLGLLALIATSLISVRIARSLLDRLGQLRRGALALADERLPSVVNRLRRGETVSVADETPEMAYGSDEIGEVGRAFVAVGRTAVAAAVDEAAVRKGMSDVFLNIARRNQTLLYRQLALLDEMERAASEPQELADLFQLDHLATRMRRHAEDLVILAGARPSRGWRDPVPLIDVVRGAVCEVEDYPRVDVRSIAAAGVVGRTVGDLIHLVAELLENATVFSPPQHRVQVTAQQVPAGVAIEIEDRGLGMSATALAQANQRLAEPPRFDPANSTRLGLFVVAQLARRHGITVTLATSAYGGVVAVVLVPAVLVTPAAESPAVLPGRRDGRLRAVPSLVEVPRQRQPVESVGEVPAVVRSGSRVELSPDGLPRRVRQASLGPDAEPAEPGRETGPAQVPAAAGSGMAPEREVRPRSSIGSVQVADVDAGRRVAALAGTRTPAEIRRMMSDLQSATRRGRADGAAAVVRLDPPEVGDAREDG